MTGPLVVSYGMGVDSTAMLVGLYRRGIRPDLILFADTGAEVAETYDYLPEIQTWLARVGFPPVTIVRYVPTRFKHWPPYYTLEQNCLTNGTLPSISFGGRSKGACSMKWKHDPQHRFLKDWEPARIAWREGRKVTKLIGFDCSIRDTQRRTYADRKAQKTKDSKSKLYDYWYALQSWGWDREQCIAEIKAAGLRVPQKSSCFFCFAMKPDELEALPVDKLRRIVLLEYRAKPRLTKIEGLWGRSTDKRPGSMTQYILDHGLLPADDVTRIQSAPDVLIRFQHSYAAGETAQNLGEFLHDNFPTLYTSAPVAAPPPPQLSLFC